MKNIHGNLASFLRVGGGGSDRPDPPYSSESSRAPTLTSGNYGVSGVALVDKDAELTSRRSAGRAVRESEQLGHDNSVPNPPLLTLIVDNYDSFTYSIFQYFSSVNGIPPVVVKNNEFPSWEALKKSLPNIDNIVISPGPGHPGNAEDFGISSCALQEAALPTLGICLGHQGFAHVYGGKVSRAPEPIHGRRSIVEFLQGYDLFRGIEQGTTVLRYHSLVVERANLPECLLVTCWTRDEHRLIMGLRHKTLPLHGVQFHPESIGTADGFRMLQNFRDMSVAWWRRNRNGKVGSARLEDVDFLSRRLLRESRIAAVGRVAGMQGTAGRGRLAAEKGDQMIGEQEAAQARGSEAAPEHRATRQSPAAAEGGGTGRGTTEDTTEGNPSPAGSFGWVVNVAVVSCARQNGKGGSKEHEQQRKQVRGDASDGVSTWAYDQAAIFEELFANDNVCFWLDSSSADDACAGVHARKQFSQRACVSYMGNCSGPFAEAVEYYEKEKKAVLRYFSPEGKTTSVTVHEADLFQLLATRLQRFSRPGEFDGNPFRSCSARGRENGSRNSSSTPDNSNSHQNSSTFRSRSSSSDVRRCSSWGASNTSSSYTSSSRNSVEVRWWEMRDGALQEVGDDRYLCRSSILPVSPVTTLQKENVKESAETLHAEDAEFTDKQPDNSSVPSSHAFPPFGFVGGYVGFFGYELRHMMEGYARLSAPPVGRHTAAASGKWGDSVKCTTDAAVAARPTKALDFESDGHDCIKRPSAEELEANSGRKRKTPGLLPKDITAKVMTYFPKQEVEAAAGETPAETYAKGGEQPDERTGQGCSTEAAAGKDGSKRDEEAGTQPQQETSIGRKQRACDAVWVFAGRVVAFDLEKNTAYVLWLTLATHATASCQAAGEKGKEGIVEYESSGWSCEQHEEEKQRSKLVGHLEPASPAACEEASAYTSPSRTTASSVSPCASFSTNLRFCDSPALTVTKGVASDSAAQTTAEEPEAVGILPSAASSGISPDECTQCFCSITRVQLAWATRTLQQLLCLSGDSRAAAAAAAPRTTFKAGGDGDPSREGMAAMRKEDERERGATVAHDAEDAGRRRSRAVMVNCSEYAGGESRNDGAEEGRTSNGAAGESEGSQRNAARQDTAEGDANRRMRKRAKVWGEKKEIENPEACTTSMEQQRHREEKNEEERGRTGQIEDPETVENETAAEASTTELRCASLGAAVEQTVRCLSSLPLGTSAGCTPSSSSPSILQDPKRAAWLLRPRDTRAQYLEKINKIFQFIASGDAYEVCLTTEFLGRLALQAEDIFQYYCFLRKRNPTPFSVFFRYQPLNNNSEHSTARSIPTVNELKSRTFSNVQDAVPTTAAAAATGAVPSPLFPEAATDPRRPATLPASTRAAGTTKAASADDSAGAAAALCSFTICCASPELFLLVDKEGWLESRPIKGTRPRGGTATADAALAQELATSEKDAAENIMAVDVARSDLGRVSVPGSVHVPELLVVESYSRVHQLISTVRGKLRPELSFFDAVASAFPGASMTGAPKKRVMELLHELEQRDRGVYSGAIGFLSVNQQAALNIPIRMLVFHDDQNCHTADSGTPKTVFCMRYILQSLERYKFPFFRTVPRLFDLRVASLGAGGAVVAASNPEEEVEEMYLKADSVLSLLYEFLSFSRTPRLDLRKAL